VRKSRVRFIPDDVCLAALSADETFTRKYLVKQFSARKFAIKYFACFFKHKEGTPKKGFF